jgi:SP family arabinose:H+ symporter-like MFS transporter
MYYAPEVFKASGGGTHAAYLSAIWVGAVNLVATLAALMLMDRAGRRPLLLVGVTIQTLALVLTGWLFHLQVQGWPLLAAIMAFTASFALAMGPIPWVLISEIFPSPIRGRAIAISIGTLWAACLLVAQTFPWLKETMGAAGTFWMYAACSFLSLLFVALWVPETRGRPLEEIARSWQSAPAR